MICFSLSSGSNGNCIYVETEHAALLFDAGISGIRTAERLAEHGRDIRNVDAVIISHDHSDHVRCAGVLSRKFGLPVHMTGCTHAAAMTYNNLGNIADLRYFHADKPLAIKDALIQPHATPHDAAEPLIFTVSSGGRKLGVLTDLGCVFDALGGLLAGLDAVFLESNYDPDMLRDGPYPPFLKARIAGEHGHISNFDSAELVRHRAGPGLQWVALSHLSETNNTPELAQHTHRHVAGTRRPIYVAPRHAVGPMLRVE
jgi:phosphoribosyl 1,2-cyclic phosphodiesterase